MAIKFDTRESPALVKEFPWPEVDGLKPANPKPPPPVAPVLNMSPRRHDVVRWDHAGFVTKTAHETKEKAIEFAASLHWATTWKYAVMCGREFVERRELEAPNDYAMCVRLYDCEMARARGGVS